jgi:hypothetical protein
MLPLFLFLPFLGLSQSSDSTQSEAYPNPNRALTYSLILPGLGQAYNHSYWKIPIVYAALGASVYFVVFNHKQYQFYKEAYRNKMDGDTLTPDPFPSIDGAIIRNLRDYYRRNRDLSILLGISAYLLNGIEAYVDAHLKPFDVSKHLTIHFFPHSVTLVYTLSSPTKHGTK